jgi:outer membrane protein assembly factor BamB
LGGITDALGTYVLTLTAAGSGITDAAGSDLSADAADQWVRRPAVIGDLLYTIQAPTDYWLTTPTPRDSFGYSVAMSGSSLAVGAPGYDYLPPPYPQDRPEYDCGRASTFDANTGDGPGSEYFLWSGPYEPDYFSGEALGRSIAVSGDFVASGGRHAWIFDPSFYLLYGAPLGSTGSPVAMSGNLAVVGDPGDDTGATDAGSVYIFDATNVLDQQTGGLLRTLHNPTPAANDNFGASVAISANLVVVGAPYDDTGAADAGSAYVFDATTGALLWTLNNPTPAPGDQFGYAVAVSANTVVVGAPFDDTGAMDAGSAYVFDAATGTLLQTLSDPAPAESDRFGWCVAAW